MSEQDIEEKLMGKNLNAPRLNPTKIDETIIKEQYHVFPDTTTTVCCLTLINGFTVIGDSAAVSSQNFDQAIGRQVAREKARDKIWELEGYLLKDRIHQDSLLK